MKDNRNYLLKFYADQPNLGINNKLFVFRVKDEKAAIKIIARFEAEDMDTKIRAAFLTPSIESFSNKMSIRFDYKEHPLYLFFKGSD
ncbi:MAG: hypothetical protein AB7E36_12060 [Salinivirgaceae bacterium]